MKNLRREALNQGSSGGDFLLRPLRTARPAKPSPAKFALLKSVLAKGESLKAILAKAVFFQSRSRKVSRQKESPLKLSLQNSPLQKVYLLKAAPCKSRIPPKPPPTKPPGKRSISQAAPNALENPSIQFLKIRSSPAPFPASSFLLPASCTRPFPHARSAASFPFSPPLVAVFQSFRLSFRHTFSSSPAFSTRPFLPVRPAASFPFISLWPFFSVFPSCLSAPLLFFARLFVPEFFPSARSVGTRKRGDQHSRSL